MALEGLPKNVNGKIDRRRIKEDFEREAARNGKQGAARSAPDMAA
jgi:hypothetical protein